MSLFTPTISQPFLLFNYYLPVPTSFNPVVLSFLAFAYNIREPPKFAEAARILQPRIFLATAYQMRFSLEDFQLVFFPSYPTDKNYACKDLAT